MFKNVNSAKNMSPILCIAYYWIYITNHSYLAGELEVFKELVPEIEEGITLDLMWSASLFELTPKK